MKIGLTIPAFSNHGGINVIIEWANQLSIYHDVVLLYNDIDNAVHQWYPIKVPIKKETYISECDILIVCSPHQYHLIEEYKPKKVYLFLQMLENEFRSNSTVWERICRRMYLSHYPMFVLSDWIKEALIKKGRTGQIIKVRNSINTSLFHVETPKKEKIVLFEGWEPTNPTKDIKRYSQTIAKEYKKQGYKIYAYGSNNIIEDFKTPDRYYKNPSLKTLNDLYRRAEVFIKCSVKDCWSTTTMEAAVKGCKIYRFVDKGDEHLKEHELCFIQKYDNARYIDPSTYDKAMIQRYKDYLISNSWSDCIKEVLKEIEK